MLKLNGSNVITGFQPILCSRFPACAQETDQNRIYKNAAILRLNKFYFPVRNEDLKKTQNVFVAVIIIAIQYPHIVVIIFWCTLCAYVRACVCKTVCKSFG